MDEERFHRSIRTPVWVAKPGCDDHIVAQVDTAAEALNAGARFKTGQQAPTFAHATDSPDEMRTAEDARPIAGYWSPAWHEQRRGSSSWPASFEHLATAPREGGAACIFVAVTAAREHRRGPSCTAHGGPRSRYCANGAVQGHAGRGWMTQHSFGGAVAPELAAGQDRLEVLAFGVHSPGDGEMVTDRAAR